MKKLSIYLVLSLCFFLPKIIHAKVTFWDCYDDILMTEILTDENNPHGSIKKLNEKIKNTSG